MKLFSKLICDIKKFKKINLILSGGKSPLGHYKILFKQKLNWDNINLYLLDDRLVKLDNKNSNYFNINKILVQNNIYNKIQPINKIYLNSNKINSLAKYLKNSATIAILGMGNDGHYGSIFVESSKYDLLTDISKSPKFYRTEPIGSPRVSRVTMNLSMILLSLKIYLILNTRKKINLFKKAKIFKNTKRYSICSLIKYSNKIAIIKN
jgi:6-phosphogluconolactonase